MPITYQINHERRIVFARGLARFTEQDAYHYQLGVWSNPAIQGYDELFDMTTVEEIEEVSAERIRQFARESAKMDQPESHSRLAIAAPEIIAFGLGRMYQVFREMSSGSTKKVGVFRSLAEASAWLGIDDLPSDWSETGTRTESPSPRVPGGSQATKQTEKETPMPDESKEADDLAKADRHILEGEGRVRDQEALVRELAADGHDTSMAEELLNSLRNTLATLRQHRELILKELDKAQE